jgi:excisionase family DNA binding protein
MLETERPVEQLLAEILREQEIKLSAPILTSDEVETYYGLTKREIAPLIKAHKIPVIRINKRVLRFHRADIEQYLSAQTIAAVNNI